MSPTPLPTFFSCGFLANHLGEPFVYVWFLILQIKVTPLVEGKGFFSIFFPTYTRWSRIWSTFSNKITLNPKHFINLIYCFPSANFTIVLIPIFKDDNILWMSHRKNNIFSLQIHGILSNMPSAFHLHGLDSSSETGVWRAFKTVGAGQGGFYDLSQFFLKNAI